MRHGMGAPNMIDDETREFAKYATPEARATAERDVCSYCLRELLILPMGFARNRGWGNTGVYEDERYTYGVHGCYPLSRLPEPYRSDFWREMWTWVYDECDDYVAREGRTKSA